MIKYKNPKDIKKYKSKLVIVHYSCSDINDKYPTISSISTYDTNLSLLTTFSREKNSKEDEISILEQFFNYISKKINNGFYFLGWYWGERYGISILIERYKQLTGKSPNIDIPKIQYFDFLKILSQEFKEFFGGLESLAEFNGLNLDKFVEGRDEIVLLKKEKFQKLNDSTSTKVGIINSLLLRYLNGDIQVPTLDEIFYSYKDIGSYPVFKENINKINELINTKNVSINDRSLQAFLRNLLYSNVITAMETYLSDTFMRIVIKDKTFLKKYISESCKFKESKKIKDLYIEMFDEIKISSNLPLDRYLIKKCISDIKDITFHNLNNTSKLYKKVLGINFPEDIGEIYKAVIIRHDLVHRNGKDKEDKLIIITLDQLKDIIKQVENLVEDIHKKTKDLIK